MPDIQAGETFADGQSLTAARLNNHVNGAEILAAFLSGKAAIVHGDVDGAADVLLLLDDSTSILKKITVDELFMVGGVVTSVGLTMPAGFTVTGSPVTSAGTLACVLANQTGNKHLASPASGVSGAPTFRARDPRDSRYGSSAIAANAIDWNLANTFSKVLGGTTAFTFSNAADGAEIVVAIAPAGFSYSWPAGIIWAGGEAHPTNFGTNVFRFIQISSAIYGRLEIENGV